MGTAWSTTPCPVAAQAGTSCATWTAQHRGVLRTGQIRLLGASRPVWAALNTATGHLLYSRFWTKFLFDRGWIGFNEPFKRMINQGMILGRSNFVYRVKAQTKFVTFEKRKEFQTQRLHVDINFVQSDKLDVEAFKAWRPEYANAEFILNDEGEYTCDHEVEKMSKSKFNVQTPDDLVERYGADTLRCYEMFLGPLTQHKPGTHKVSVATISCANCTASFHKPRPVQPPPTTSTASYTRPSKKSVTTWIAMPSIP